jgi:hypothetical protein
VSKWVSKWDGSFQQIRRRSAADVRTNLNVAVPFLFDIQGQESDLPGYLDSQWETLTRSENSVISLPGRDMNLVRDTLMAASRFYHVIDCARAQVRRGAMTWAMVDSYHASLLGAKAMFALYGLFAYGVRDRTVLVDFRPELGSVDHAKKFKKANKTVEHPIRVLTPKPKHLEQQDAWALVTRLCNITLTTPEDVELIDRIKESAGSPLSAFRNATLYDSVAWQWPSDLAPPRMTPANRIARIAAEDEFQSTSLKALAAIFEFVTANIKKLGSGLSYDPTKLSRIFDKPGTPVGLLT